jgi:predicted RNA methylase
MRTKQVSPEVLAVLRGSEWDANVLRLPPTQLERKLYLAVHDALLSLGGKWDRKAKGHVFAEAAHDALESLIESGEYVSAADTKQLLGQFETPDRLADEVATACRIETSHQVLEPSAGSGRLVKAAGNFGPSSITAIEIDKRFISALEEHYDTNDVEHADFLSVKPYAVFHRVLMNPPYARQQDIDHVLHAWKFLAPGGRLVALMSAGWTFRENEKSRAFRGFVDTHGEWKPNEPGAFKESGTMVNSVMVVLDK